MISFRHISRDDPLATVYLRFMCFLAEKDIPQSLLPPARKIRAADALGALKAHAFITERERSRSFDMQRLVRLAVRNWLKEEGELEQSTTSVVQHLAKAFPIQSTRTGIYGWDGYLPNTQAALESRADSIDRQAEWLLLS